MKTVSVYNLKGGVGKTAAAVNLSLAAALEGRTTLLCDLDAQGAASYYFRVRPKSVGAKKLVKGSSEVEEAIKATDYEHLHLLPASLSFRKLPVVLNEVKHSRRRLRDALKPLGAQYELIVLDTHAGLDLESENVFRASDIVLIPLIPTTLSVNTYGTMLEFFAKHKLDTSRVRAFFSMVDRRRTLHTTTMQQLSGEDRRILSTAVPNSAEVEKMGTSREPLLARHRRTKAARAYLDLWQELRGLLEV
jgi:cellulose biosynthesis protein BcsQ